MLEFTKVFEAFNPYREDFNDRLILESMHTPRIRRILTADCSFARYPDLEVLDPVAFKEWLEGRRFSFFHQIC